MGLHGNLKKNSKKINSTFSEYWVDRLKKDTVKKELYYGYGGFKYRKHNIFIFYLLNFLHFIFQYFTFSKKLHFIFKSKNYKIIKKLSKLTLTPTDWRKIRHCFIFHELDKYFNKSRVIGVIGDGFATATYLLLKKYKNIKIISINLDPILLDDYLVLNKCKLKNNIMDYAKTSKDVNNFLKSKKKILFISSKNKKILMKKKIDFYLNIFSFNEMTRNEINKYIKIIRSSNSFLYSVNPKKKWTIVNKNKKKHIYHNKIDFKDSKLIFKNEPEWLNKIYNIRDLKTLNFSGHEYSKMRIIKQELRKFS